MKHLTSIRLVVGALVFALVAAFGNMGQARADSVSDFYKGKKGAMIIGSSVGGGYNQYGRLIARHIQRHIPGKPDIVPKKDRKSVV